MKKIMCFKFAVTTTKKMSTIRSPYFVKASSDKDAYMKLIFDIYESLEEYEVLDRIEFITVHDL